LDRFIRAKSFQESDNEITYLEGGIHILGQSMESSSEALSLPHEAPSIDNPLSDVIGRIRRHKCDPAPTQSTE